MTGEVDKSVRCSCRIFSGFIIPKIIKIGQFWQSYSKNKKMDVFRNTEYNNLHHVVNL